MDKIERSESLRPEEEKMDLISVEDACNEHELREPNFSREFRALALKTLSNPGESEHAAITSLLNLNPISNTLTNLPELYIPETFQIDEPSLAQKTANFRALCNLGQYDEVRTMLHESKPFKAEGWLQRKLSWTTVPQGQLKIISDHSGRNHGVHFMVWGPGKKKPMFMSNFKSGQLLGIINTAQICPIDPEYFHIPGRCTIANIKKNELGLVYNLDENKIYSVIQGRYFFNENTHQFLGKFKNDQVNSIEELTTNRQQSHLDKFNQRFQLATIRPGYIGFIKTKAATYILPPRQMAYFIDKQNGQALLNICSTHKPVTAALDRSLYYVQLRENEYISFKYQLKPVVWFYNSEHHQFNSLTIDSNFFEFSGSISRLSAPTLIDASLKLVPDRSSLVLKEEQAAANARLIIAKQEKETTELKLAKKKLEMEYEYSLLQKFAETKELEASTAASTIKKINEARLALIPQDKRFEFEALRIQADILKGKDSESVYSINEIGNRMQQFIDSLNDGRAHLSRPLTPDLEPSTPVTNKLKP